MKLIIFVVRHGVVCYGFVRGSLVFKGDRIAFHWHYNSKCVLLRLKLYIYLFRNSVF